MVKKYILSFLIFSWIFFTGNCVDITGLFASNDLNTRLKEKNNFMFLENSERNLSFGNDYSFIVLSDIHIKGADSWGLEKLKTVIADSKGEIKFVVVTGDITQGGEKEDIKEFIRVARSFGIPCYPVIGNHDIYFNNWHFWKDLIGSTSYKINGNGTTLLVLDSASSYFGKDQIDWLEKEIKNVKGRAFVFSHCNIFDDYQPNLQQVTNMDERARLLSVLQNKCDIMFMGHSHKRLIKEAGGVIYINIEDFTGNKTYLLVSVNNSDVSYNFKKL